MSHCCVLQQGWSGELSGHGTDRPMCPKGPPDQPPLITSKAEPQEYGSQGGLTVVWHCASEFLGATDLKAGALPWSRLFDYSPEGRAPATTSFSVTEVTRIGKATHGVSDRASLGGLWLIGGCSLGVSSKGWSGERLGHGTVRPWCPKGPPEQSSVDSAARRSTPARVELMFRHHAACSKGPGP